jgi:hypothetical protein
MRNQLAKQVVEAGIKTVKNPFFMSAKDLQAVLDSNKSTSVTKVIRGEKGMLIIAKIKAGKTRQTILTEMEQTGMPTTVGYLNNISRCKNLKIQK